MAQEGTSLRRVAGIDGCRGGWVVAVVPLAGTGSVSLERTTDLADVVARLDAGLLDAVGIDMPIGLPAGGPRCCDVEARRKVGPRRSSVFPAPVRSALGAPDYGEALRRSRAVSGRGLSRQTFGILPKVHELDEVMTTERQARLVEVHPEVSFAVLAGHPMAHPKRTPQGGAERLAVLRSAFIDVDGCAGIPIAGVRLDDVLDALAAAWSARRLAQGIATRMGGDVDARGLRMEIVA
jgi:predicted RNase H-like nuclease